MAGTIGAVAFVDMLDVSTGGVLAVFGVSGVGELLMLVGPCGTATGGIEILGKELEGGFEVPDDGASMGEDVTLLKTIESGMSNPRGIFSSKLVVKKAIPAFPMPCIGPPLTFSQPLIGGAGR